MHARIENGQVSEFPIVNLRQHLSNISLPQNLSDDSLLPEGYVYVTYVAPPQFDPSCQKPVAKNSPELLNGKWVIKYEIVDLSYEELEQVELNARENAKQSRTSAVESIVVTTTAGNTFDGNEVSQARMLKYILILSAGAVTTVPWTLADNTVVNVNKDELTEALSKAAAAQSALWLI